MTEDQTIEGNDPLVADAQEQMVLGGSLLDAQELELLRQNLKPQDFRLPKHQNLFRLMCQMQDDGDPVELTSVLQRVLSLDVDDFGGALYVSRLSDNAVTHNLGYYAKGVREAATRRRYRLIAKMCQDQAERPDVDMAALVSSAESLLGDVLDSTAGLIGEHRSEWCSLGDAVHSALDTADANRMAAAQGEAVNLVIGVDELDYSDDPRFEPPIVLQAPDVLGIAARPGVGKTSLAMQMLEANARRGHVGAFLSLEQPREQVGSSMVMRGTDVTVGKLRTGNIDTGEWDQLETRAREIEDLPIFINDKPEQTAKAVELSVRRLLRTQDVKLVVIDYLGRMEHPKGSRQEREAHLALQKTMHHIEAMAKRLKVAAVILIQLNRACDTEEPQKRHMHGGSAIEKGLAWLLALWEDPKDKHQNQAWKSEGKPTKIWGVLLKARFGAEQRFELSFDGPNQRVEGPLSFANPDPHEMGDNPWERDY